MKPSSGPSKAELRPLLHRATPALRGAAYVLGGVVGLSAWSLMGTDSSDAVPTEITVYKPATCECCRRWIDHLQRNGFKVAVRDVEQLAPIRDQLGVPRNLAACHTATVGGYVVEGHVPADAIRKLLEDRPRAKGLAVPGMPVGPPGMEGGMQQRYSVHLVDDGGRTVVYQRR